MSNTLSLGAHYTPVETVFRLWAPQAVQVLLQRFCTGSDEELGAGFLGEIPMRQVGNGIFECRVQGNLKNQYYQYLLTDCTGQQTWAADPWATACGVNGKRSMVVDMAATNPAGWEEDHGPEQGGKAPAIWEVHVRDFSEHPSSGVTEWKRGKYLAFTEPNTTLDGKGITPTCINYLKRLGITHIQLQPVFDYCTVDERSSKMYNWGYDPENYNVPEGSYATDPYHGAVRIREFKQMIQAIHQAGLGVVMDVVYNHTYTPDSWLQRTAPGAYYRYMPDGHPANASGCGSETASDRKPFRDYMIASICYWAEEYHIDGFRFDLMAIHDVETMNLIRSKLDELPDGKRILTYGEPWSALPTRMRPDAIPASKAAVRQFHSRLGIFCDDTRNALVGSAFNVFERGYGTGSPTYDATRKVEAAVHGWCDRAKMGYAHNPGQILQYVSCHDNYTLWDRLTLQHNTSNFDAPLPEQIQQNKLVSGICLTVPGIGFFQAGEEFGRTKKGNSNSYTGPAELNWLDWRRMERFSELVEWYRGLLELREEIVPLSHLEYRAIREIIYLETPENCVGFAMTGERTGIWEQFLVYYNPYNWEQTVELPRGEWQLLCDGISSTLWKKPMKSFEGEYQLPPLTVTIFGKE
jgi:pullulanase